MFSHNYGGQLPETKQGVYGRSTQRNRKEGGGYCRRIGGPCSDSLEQILSVSNINEHIATTEGGKKSSEILM